MSWRLRSVSTCAINRTTRSIAPGTGISVAHMNGTSVTPACRAAYAGNSATRSGVEVKNTLIRSSALSSLRPRTAWISLATPASKSSRSSESIWIAPRTARTATCTNSMGRDSLPDEVVPRADLTAGQVSHPTGFERAEGDRSVLGAYQAGHWLPDLLEQPAHDVLAAFVQ